jgi:acyl-phosphate glycerol 3-phosphate acyltransferase
MDMTLLIAAGLVLGAYLLGSVSSAIIVCRLMGLPDPRTQGSNNPGATNVLRIGGSKAKPAAAITLAGDMLKGLIPMLVAHLLQAAPLTLALVGIAAFVGHLFPVFFGFRGGKGVATALGVQFGLYWPIGAATAAAHEHAELLLALFHDLVDLGDLRVVATAVGRASTATATVVTASAAAPPGATGITSHQLSLS